MVTDSIKVSVIVPVYKVEKYLDRCVLSLINQTLDQIEIILVDDGSPDQCPTLCDIYAKRYPQIKVIHKTNGGLSSARNAGLAIASGEFIGFVDSDDDVEPDMYEKMYNTANQENVDFVMADYLRIREDGRRCLKTLDIPSGLYDKKRIRKIIFPQLIMQECVDYGPLLSVCHCLYRADFLRKHNLCFDEQVRWSEDNIFSAIMGYYCDSFYYMKGEGLYHYYQNPGTITTSYRKGAWQVYCTMNDHLRDFFEEVKDYDFSRQLKLHMLYYACNCIEMEMNLNRKEAIISIQSIMNSPKLMEVFDGFKFPIVSVKLKIQLFLMKMRWARILWIIKV
ncbi:MAG: glycosyltransferase [Oliverpabstia sp.]